MKLTNGIFFPLEVGVVSDEFCVLSVHSGSCVEKKSWKWFRTFREPAVPGTRGIRIGESRAPSWISKSASEGFGRKLRVSSERSFQAEVKAVKRRRAKGRRMAMVAGSRDCNAKPGRRVLEVIGSV